MFRFRRKKDVVVVDGDGYYRNLKQEVDELKRAVKELKRANDKLADFVEDQIHVNQNLLEMHKRMKSDVDALKHRTD